jgi:glycerol-3-phosphate acyltransferase PlsY
VTGDPQWWQLVLAAVVGFAVGSINPATLIASARGVNLREVGSGNPGATNTARALGKGTGVLVGVFDILKGLLPALAFSPWGPAAAGMAGLFAVLGHIFSPFLRGRGGKGVATTLGAVLGVQPVWAIPMLVAFGITVAITRRMGLGAVAGAVALIVIGLWWAEPWENQVFAITLGVVVIIRHESNLRAAFGVAGGEHD